MNHKQGFFDHTMTNTIIVFKLSQKKRRRRMGRQRLENARNVIVQSQRERKQANAWRSDEIRK